MQFEAQRHNSCIWLFNLSYVIILKLKYYMSGSYEFVEIQMHEYILANKYMDIHVNKYALPKKQC